MSHPVGNRSSAESAQTIWRWLRAVYPNSRATLWVTIVPLFVIASIVFNWPIQLGDVLSTESISEPEPANRKLEIPPGIILSVPWVLFTTLALIEWLLIRRSIGLLDHILLFDDRNKSAYPELWCQRKRSIKGRHSELFVRRYPAKLFRQWIVRLDRVSRQWTKNRRQSMQFLVTALFQDLALIVPSSFCMAFMANDARYLPGLAYFCVLVLSIHIGSALSLIHLSINFGQHFIPLFALLPFLLMVFGLFAIDATAYIILVILWSLLFVTAVYVVQCIYVRIRGIGFLYTAAIAGSFLLPSEGETRRDFASPVAFQEPLDRHRVDLRSNPIAFDPSIVSLMPESHSRWTAPVVFLNMGGGGTRASIFNGLMLERLWWHDLEGTYPGAMVQKAAIRGLLPAEVSQIVCPEKHFYGGRLLLLNSRFVSSVSGGTLTSAFWNHFVQEQVQCALPDFEVEPSKEQILIARAKALRQYFEPKPDDPKGNPSNYLPLGPEIANAESCFLELTSDQVDRIERTRTATNMRKNFLAATIVGAFNPWGDRVKSLKTMWDQEFGWRLNVSTNPGASVKFSDFAHGEASGSIPFLLFNTTSTQTGERIVITNLHKEWFMARPGLGVVTENVSPIPGRAVKRLPATLFRVSTTPGGLRTHREVHEMWNPDLSAAVWASSDFPYGFPVNRLFGASADVQRHEDGWVSTTDGGVVDNTGTDTTLGVVRAIVSSDHKGEVVRPVFVLQIDTSELPITPSGSNKALFQLVEAYRAQKLSSMANQQSHLNYAMMEMSTLLGSQIEQASIEKSQMSIVEHKKALRLVMSSRDISKRPLSECEVKGKATYNVGFVAPDQRWSFFSIRGGELSDDHVPTSWHLAKASRAKLYRVAFSDCVTAAIDGASRAYIKMFCTALSGSPAESQNSDAKAMPRLSSE